MNYWIDLANNTVWLNIDEIQANETKIIFATKEEGYAPDFNSAPPSSFTDTFDRADSNIVGNNWIESEGANSYTYISSNALYVYEYGSGVYVCTLYRLVPDLNNLLTSISWKYYAPNQSYIMANFIGFLKEDLSALFYINMNTDRKIYIVYDGTTIASSSSTFSLGAFNAFRLEYDWDTKTAQIYCNDNLYIDTTLDIDLTSAKYFFVARPDGYHQTGSGSSRSGTYRYDDVSYQSTLPFMIDISQGTPRTITITNNSDNVFQNVSIPLDATALEVTTETDSIYFSYGTPSDILKTTVITMCKQDCISEW